VQRNTAIREVVDMSEPFSSNSLAKLSFASCRYGTMIYFTHDEVIGRSLQMYGEWSEHELAYLRPYVRPDSTVVDIGANIGTHTLAFARFGAHVIAIEGHPMIAAILKVNSGINGCDAEVVNAVCADTRRWGQPSPALIETSNVGATSFVSAKLDKLSNRFSWRPCLTSLTKVAFLRLDDLVIGPNISLIKIDVEGMERQVLRGGINTIRNCNPVLFVEQLNTEDISPIINFIKPLGYQAYWLETHQFNQRNIRGNPENIWYRTETALLCVPPNLPPRTDLERACEDAIAVPSILDARIGWKGSLETSAISS
jgi:FkbM family methyltransferase